MLKTASSSDSAVRAPVAGEIMTNLGLTQTFRTLATDGNNGFYRGYIADAIVEAVRERGGYLSHADLSYHANMGSIVTSPLCVRFNKVVDIWEYLPNG
jgi:gamma-glutamyltranspeptidase/glutathione hydrolase